MTPLRSPLFPPLFSGLAGFFPLHPMTVTEAERRMTKAELEAAAGAAAAENLEEATEHRPEQ